MAASIAALSASLAALSASLLNGGIIKGVPAMIILVIFSVMLFIAVYLFARIVFTK